MNLSQFLYFIKLIKLLKLKKNIYIKLFDKVNIIVNVVTIN